jgi:hypothetical protein
MPKTVVKESSPSVFNQKQKNAFSQYKFIPAPLNVIKEEADKDETQSKFNTSVQVTKTLAFEPPSPATVNKSN